MITGAVMGNGDPLVQLLVRDAQGVDHPINFVVDTGYNGSLALPPRWITRLALVPVDTSSITLADGSVTQVSYYETVVLWDGYERIVSVNELAGDPLIGTSLLFDHDVTIRFINGGPVTIARTP